MECIPACIGLGISKADGMVEYMPACTGLHIGKVIGKVECIQA